MPETLARKIGSSMLWLGGARALGQAVSWLSTLVVIRILTPEDYGLMAMAGVFLALLLPIADLGVGAAAIQAKELSREEERSIYGLSILTTSSLFLVVYLGAPLAAAYFSEPRVLLIIRVISFNFLLVGLSIFPQWRLVRALDFKRKAKVEAVATMVSAATALSMAFLGFGVWALVLGSMAVYATRALLYNLVVGAGMWPSFKFARVGALVRFSTLTTLGRLAFYLYATVDVIIAGPFLDADTLGLYAVAVTLSAIPLDRLFPVINQVSFAAYSRMQDDKDRVARNVVRAMQFASIAFVPTVLGLALVAPEFIELAFGGEWTAMVRPFQFICLALPFRALTSVLSPALLGMGKAGLHLGNRLLLLSGMSLAYWVGVQSGVFGLSLAWAVGLPPLALIIAYVSLRAVAVPIGVAARAIRGPLLAALVMAGSVLAVGATLPEVPAAVRLATMVTAGVVVYGAVMWTTQRHLVDEVRQLMARQ